MQRARNNILWHEEIWQHSVHRRILSPQNSIKENNGGRGKKEGIISSKREEFEKSYQLRTPIPNMMRLIEEVKEEDWEVSFLNLCL